MMITATANKLQIDAEHTSEDLKESGAADCNDELKDLKLYAESQHAGKADPSVAEDRRRPSANLIQTSIFRVENGGTRRVPLRNALGEIRPLRMRKSSFVVRRVGKQDEVPLFGQRVMKIQIAKDEHDDEPSFADNTVYIQAGPTNGMIVAFVSPSALDSWCSSFCAAGAIMRDFGDHFTISGTLPGGMRLVRPLTTSRLSTAEAEHFALKADTGAEKKRQIVNDVYFLLTLDHTGIPRAHGIYEVKILGEPGLGMLLDYKDGSDLSIWIPEDGFPERALKGIVTQIRDVLLYLHGRFIVHRDIKPSNILVEMTGDGSLKVYVSDFGLAAHVEERDAISNRCGTPGYLAPEILEAGWTDGLSSPLADPQEVLKTDVFSFGVLIYTAVLGKNPLHGPTQRQTYKNNARGIQRVEGESGLSGELRDLLSRCTARDPRNRCSIFDAAGHAWFQED